MKISCEACHTVYQVAAEKVPAGGARLNCPNCGRVLIITPPAKEQDSSPLLVPGSQDYGQTMGYDYQQVMQDQGEAVALLREASARTPHLEEGVRYALRDSVTGEEYPLEKAEITVGRSGTSLILHDPEVSRRHSLVRVMGDHVLVVDQESTNGTYVDGKKVLTAKLLHGQSFSLGNTTLEVIIERGKG